jgi:hypothetical protein
MSGRSTLKIIKNISNNCRLILDEIERMKANKRYLAFPLFVLLIVTASTSYSLYLQSTLAEHSEDIIKLLLWVIVILGTGFVALIVYLTKTIVEKLERVEKKVDSVNLRCVAFHPELIVDNLPSDLKREFEKKV